jgi:hypothetical protein
LKLDIASFFCYFWISKFLNFVGIFKRWTQKPTKITTQNSWIAYSRFFLVYRIVNQHSLSLSISCLCSDLCLSDMLFPNQNKLISTDDECINIMQYRWNLFAVGELMCGSTFLVSMLVLFWNKFDIIGLCYTCMHY